MFDLALPFVYVFFCPFGLLSTFLGEERAGLLYLSCICLLSVRALICVTFSIPPGVGGWLRLLWLAPLRFLHGQSNVITSVKREPKQPCFGHCCFVPSLRRQTLTSILIIMQLKIQMNFRETSC